MRTKFHGPQYENYYKLIHKKAWQFSRKSRLDVEELKSQGNLIFCEAMNTYDDQRSSFLTYLYMRLDAGLTRYCEKNQRYIHEELTDEMSLYHPNNDYDIMMKSLEIKMQMSKLSESAKKILRVVYNNYTKIFNVAGPKEVRGQIIAYLKQQGENMYTINRGMTELRQLYKEI